MNTTAPTQARSDLSLQDTMAMVTEDPNCFSNAAAEQMERMVADFGRMYRERNEALQEVARAHHDALLRLARAAEYRDDDTGVHIVRMGYLSAALARRLGQSAAQAELLMQAAPMHDIGKIGMPDDVLKKRSDFTENDRVVMNLHPHIGAEILGKSRIPLFQLAAEVALTHHERWDGKGYPAGLAGEAIPISGRIVAVIDFFDALTMDRCYRPAFDDETALQMVLLERGHAFDPHVVDTFMAYASELIPLRDRINREHLEISSLTELSALGDLDTAKPPATRSEGH